MLWLLIQMGSLLGAAALCGTFIGWAVRGLLLKGRTRRAMVERDIAVTELGQARSELDSLYAAQKSGVTAAVEAGDSALKNELQEREEKVHSLTSALAASQEQLEKLKELKASAVSAAASGGPSRGGSNPVPQLDETFDAPIHQPSAEFEWRNRYLESRVRSLESKLGELTAQGETTSSNADEAELAADLSPAEAAETSAVQVNEVVDAGAVAVDHGSSTEHAKLSWLNSYWRQRSDYMDAHPIADRDGLYVSDAPEVPLDEAEAIHEVESAPESSGEDAENSAEIAEDSSNGPSSGQLEQEMARLRWRNRYLEGRLAYIEGDTERSEEAASASQSSAGSDAATAIQPPLVSRPDDDGDDFTQIRGVTPEMKLTLNNIGIWRFTQIASWSRDHVAWIAEQLTSDGDTNYQDWVEQADVLAKGGGSA
ncbi:MAG: hypothetical protein AAF583_16405 [Pseudomonadota bacterium]